MVWAVKNNNLTISEFIVDIKCLNSLIDLHCGDL